MESKSQEGKVLMMIKINLTVNGKRKTVDLEPSLSLMDFLRDTLGIKGVKVCCNIGECGACTVLLDGKLVNSCVVLAADAADCQIVTVEGIAEGDKLHPVQEAFIERGAAQCGYCTPGFIMVGKTLLDQNPTPTLEEIKDFIYGNICRCTGYTKIIEAIQVASKQMEGKGGQP